MRIHIYLLAIFFILVSRVHRLVEKVYYVIRVYNILGISKWSLEANKTWFIWIFSCKFNKPFNPPEMLFKKVSNIKK